MSFVLFVLVLLATHVKGQGVKVDDFTRNLVGYGSHRELKTEITLELDENRYDPCSLIIVEDLPRAVFADTFQLQRLARMGRYEAVHVSGDLDLEKPAIFSRPVTVEIHVPCAAEQPSRCRAEASVPLHARYAPVSLESYYVANLSSPSVALKCKNIMERDQVEVPASTVQWPIPAGNPDHTSTVNICTAIAAVAGTLVLCSVALMKNGLVPLHRKISPE